MRWTALAAASLLALCGSWRTAAVAADLVWEVESPFRLFKQTKFVCPARERIQAGARRSPTRPLPADIIWRLERRLNDPDCKDRSTPDRCAATAGRAMSRSRLGWAAQTLSAVCFESDGNPRRYLGVCERRYSWGAAREDYILPEAHTVNIGLAPAHTVSGECQWSWQPRRPGGKAESRKLACASRLTIPRVPFSPTARVSGVVGRRQTAGRPRIVRRSSSSTTCWSWRSAIRLRPAKATRTGR